MPAWPLKRRWRRVGFECHYTPPGCYQNLAGWQRYFDLDAHSTQVPLTAEFNPETGAVHWTADGPLPETQPVDGLPAGAVSLRPGPGTD